MHAEVVAALGGEAPRPPPAKRSRFRCTKRRQVHPAHQSGPLAQTWRSGKRPTGPSNPHIGGKASVCRVRVHLESTPSVSTPMSGDCLGSHSPAAPPRIGVSPFPSFALQQTPPVTSLYSESALMPPPLPHTVRITSLKYKWHVGCLADQSWRIADQFTWGGPRGARLFRKVGLSPWFREEPMV